ncbi:C-X-C motif chemokine 10-like [Bufo gargarizans]|uniref:C-X-C motif chemokine 10-like n=1 Tax=Bufo bufo TaxID=8384 RepID=UPI001ABE7BDE|nr:C-X-C motif chemokine 10-like [Bufo bufo]XP_044133338.1 C-X-C motif chemokine 10-like [Bufo gargarizans]
MDCKITAIICAVLLSATLIQGAVLPQGNRCKCTKVSTKLNIKTMEKLEIYPRSSTCENVEYIATFKKRTIPICVSPDLKEVKALLGRKNQQLRHIEVIHRQ